ncbi:MAG: transcription antitermination factor NusB [Halanaerobiales bacterium]
MKISRHKQRTWAMQIMYGLDVQRSINKEDALKEIEKRKKEEKIKRKEKNYYFEKLVLGVIENQEYIDKTIEKNAIGWHLYRMPVVDRNILRIALFEIIDELAIGIVINEAVELAKEFGSEKSSSFINGVLSNVDQNEGDL